MLASPPRLRAGDPTGVAAANSAADACVDTQHGGGAWAGDTLHELAGANTSALGLHNTHTHTQLPTSTSPNHHGGGYRGHGGSALFSPANATKNAHFDFAESGYSEGHFPRVQDFNSQGNVSLLSALSAYGGNSAASLSKASPRVSALLSRVFSYEQVLEEMVDTMMGGEDGNGAKDWSTVHDLVKTVPAVCGEKGTWDRMGLHYACSNGAPLDVVDAFLATFPNAARLPCRWRAGGWLPLHCACVTQAPLGVVMLLLNAFPEAARLEDDDGRLPLHRACEFRSQPECVAALLHFHPKAARALDAGRLGKHKRDELDEERRRHHDKQKAFDQRKRQRLKQLTQGSSKFTLVSYSTPREPDPPPPPPPLPSRREDLSCRYALALALEAAPLELHPDWDVVMQLLQAYTEPPCKRKNPDSSRALHRACRRGAPPEVVQCMLAAYPRAVRKPDGVMGRLPLHWLASYEGIQRGYFGSVHSAWEVDIKEEGFDDSSSQVIRKKIRTEAPTEKEEAEMKMQALRGPKMLVRIVKKKKKKNEQPQPQQQPPSGSYMTPPSPSTQDSLKEVLTMLLDAFPNAVRNTDKNGMYPLFLAFEAQYSTSRMADEASFPPEADKSLVLGDSQEMMATLVETLTHAYPLADELWRGVRDMREIVSAMGGDRFFNRGNDHAIAVMVARAAALPCPPPLPGEVDWMTVKGLSCNCKEASNRKGPGGRTLLHYACANGAPVHVLEAMLDQHPVSAGLADRSRGWLPLHYAVGCACAAENAARSLKKKQQLVHGRMHNKKRRAQIVKRHRAENGQNEGRGKEEEEEEEEEEEGGGSSKDGNKHDETEANEALSAEEEKRSAQLQYFTEFAEVTAVAILSTLLKVYPASAKETTGREGFLPLHLACEGQASLPVIALLLRAYRKGIRERGKRSVGTLPLSLALKSGCNMALRPKAATRATKTPHKRQGNISSSRKLGDGDGNSNSNAARHSASPFAFCIATPLWPVVSLLLEAYPAAAKEVITKREAQYPIHVLSRLLAPLPLLRRVLRIDPGSIRKEDRLGKIAMYYAVQSRAPLPIMELLYDAFPESAAVYAKPGLPNRIAKWQARRPGMPVVSRNAHEIQDLRQRRGFLPKTIITPTKIFNDPQFVSTTKLLDRRRRERGSTFDELADLVEITGQRPNLTGNTCDVGAYMFRLVEKGPHIKSALDPVPGPIYRLRGNEFDHWDYQHEPWDSARGAGFPTRESMRFHHALQWEARPGFTAFKPDWEQIDREFEEAAQKKRAEAAAAAAGGWKFSPIKRVDPSKRGVGGPLDAKGREAGETEGEVVARAGPDAKPIESWYGRPHEWYLGKRSTIKKSKKAQQLHNTSVMSSMSSHDTLSSSSNATV
jgi:ankyrin repeat protein